MQNKNAKQNAIKNAKKIEIQNVQKRGVKISKKT